MDNIARILVLTDIGRYIITFLFTEIGNTAHPRTERPQGGHARLSYQIGVLVQNIFRLAEENEQIQVLVTHEHFVQPNIGSTKITSHGSGCMHKHTISPVTHKERNRFVHLVRLRPLWVCNEQVHLLSGLVQPSGRLSATKNHFICSQGKYRIDAASIVASPLHKTERRIFYLRRVRVAQSGSLAQDTSGFILQDDSPRILVNLNGSIVAGIDNLVIRLDNFPASIPARFLCQHDGSGRFGFHRGR